LRKDIGWSNGGYVGKKSSFEDFGMYSFGIIFKAWFLKAIEGEYIYIQVFIYYFKAYFEERAYKNEGKYFGGV
jgi:hypothetical protein